MELQNSATISKATTTIEAETKAILIATKECSRHSSWAFPMSYLKETAKPFVIVYTLLGQERNNRTGNHRFFYVN